MNFKRFKQTMYRPTTQMQVEAIVNKCLKMSKADWEDLLDEYVHTEGYDIFSSTSMADVISNIISKACHARMNIGELVVEKHQLAFPKMTAIRIMCDSLVEWSYLCTVLYGVSTSEVIRALAEYGKIPTTNSERLEFANVLDNRRADPGDEAHREALITPRDTV